MLKNTKIVRELVMKGNEGWNLETLANIFACIRYCQNLEGKEKETFIRKYGIDVWEEIHEVEEIS